MRPASIPARVPARPFRSKRLLALAGDDKLVEQIRRGSEAAFEVAFERHGAGILAFCRHMLGSLEEAEDAVQHTFAAAFRELQGGGQRKLALKPWLYAIARNRCVSLLRSRREHPTEELHMSTAGLAEQVERRAELRDLLRDLRELPEDQREALLLSEAGDLSHAELAQVLGCEVARVKALVFRARGGVIRRRAARQTPCAEIREQLANLRGGSLRRNELRHHLRECAGCRAYREKVRQQRRMLAAALPVVPSLSLKSSVLGSLGLGGGSAGGGLAVGLGGLGATASATLGSATVAKVALVGVLAGGGAVAGKTAIDETRESRESRPRVTAAAPSGSSANEVEHPNRVGGGGAPRREPRDRLALGPPAGAGPTERGVDRPAPPAERRPGPRADARGGTMASAVSLGRAREESGQGTGRAERLERQAQGNGRGPIDAPPAGTPMKPIRPKPKPTAERPATGKPATPPPARPATPPPAAARPPRVEKPKPPPAAAAPQRVGKPGPRVEKPKPPPAVDSASPPPVAETTPKEQPSPPRHQ